MPVSLNQSNITYFPVPKTACTSLKYLFYFINYGHEFEMKLVDGEWRHIHNSAYPTSAFQSVDRSQLIDHIRLCVIRDPVARMLSAYSNRVGFHKELSEEHIDVDHALQLGVHPNPSPDHFFNNIEKFRILSGSIRHHTDLTSVFLGPDLRYYHRVFRIENLDELVRFLSAVTGRELVLGREQVGGEKVTFQQLNERAQRNLLQYCYSDYALMQGYYMPPDLQP